MMDGMNNVWGMGYGWIIGLIVLIFIIGLIVNANKKNLNRQKYNSPLDILKTRYARGEISKDEYDEKRRHIS
ncbi:MAG: SHOCT domain-containing protein [Bacteroidia bacterium]|nr:SHOCT domain-containing protein [Bacteroidia bacterium]